jgi:hypothetical protein
MNTRITSLLLTATLLGGVAVAQEKKELEKAVVSADTEAQSPDKKLEALIERFNKERSEVIEAYQKAESDEERATIIAKLPGKGYIPDFRALAEEAKGTNTAAKAWMWVLRLIENDPKQAWEVVELLLSEHMQSPALDELSGELRYAAHEHGEGRVIEALRAIVSESPHERVRAGAMFTLGAVLLESDKAENKAEGRDCFEAVIAEYGKLSYGSSSTYEAAATGYLFELDHLQIGMAAPDFQSSDENGVDWKLSDYKGKVVVVDFWGNW